MPTSVLAVDESMSDEQLLLAQAFADTTTLAAGTVITGTEDADTLSGPLGATGNDTVYGLGGDDFIEVTLTGAVSVAVVDGGTGTNTLSVQGNWSTLAEVLPVRLSYDAASGGQGWTFSSGDSAVAFTNIFTQNTTTGFWQGTAQFATRSYELLNAATVNALVSYSEYPEDNLMVFMVEGGPSFALSSLPTSLNLLTTDSFTVFGTQLGDVVTLGSGADEIVTQSGNDSIIGGAGNDTIWAGDGNDSIDAGNSDSSFGKDTVDGGSGSDWLFFSRLPAAVSVNLEEHTASSTLGDMAITAIEKVTGSGFADVITGGDIANKTDAMGNRVTEWFRGNAGNDTITGGAGADFFTAADYFNNTATQGVVANLGTGIAADGRGGTDTLVNIDFLVGGAGNDSLIGGSLSRGASGSFYEALRGMAGNDTLDGSNSTSDGDYASEDRADYSNNTSTQAVNVNLSTGTASDGFGGTDTLIAIDQVYGGAGNDTLTGGSDREGFDGGVGDDVIDGGGGSDHVRFQQSTAAVVVNLSALSLTVGSKTVAAATADDGMGGTDTLVNIENVRGSDFDDYFRGSDDSSVRQLFSGDGGNDTIDGGAGVDIAGYGDVPLISGGITASLLANASGDVLVSDGKGGTDTLLNIEGLSGTNSADALTGSAGNDYLRGQGGSDTLDGGDGYDWASYTGDPSRVTVNLQTGQATDGWNGESGVLAMGGTDTLINIENVEGSDFNDSITGTESTNRLLGRGGYDTLRGGAGNDTLLGGDGHDNVEGGVGDDSLDGGANDPSIGFDWVLYQNAAGSVQVNFTTGLATGADGNDTIVSFDAMAGGNFDDALTGDAAMNVLRGNRGNDSLDGGAGFDFADYALATDSVTVSLVSNTSSGFDGNDILTSIEAIRGGRAGDLLTGDANGNWLRGNGGDDTLEGGAGLDTADYYLATGGVSVSLESGTSSGADGTDQLSGFENLRGSLSYGDNLAGDTGNNTMEGMGGNDTLSGGAGQDFLNGGTGDDLLDGGASDSTLGFDWAAYDAASGAVQVNLFTGAATGADGNDTLTGFEAMSGSRFADSLTGDGINNILRGNGGNDTLDGGDGFDQADYGLASTSVFVSLLTNTSTGADGVDTLLSIEGIRGGKANDTLTGDADSNIIRGNGGNDTLDGGDGVDTVDYYLASGAVTVDLVMGTSSGADGTDTFVNFENINGSFNHGDSLTGNDGNNKIQGLGGNDYLQGGGGDDYLLGGDGDDTVTGASGNATVDGGAGIDTWLGDAGQSNLVGAVPSGDANDGWNLVLESGEVVGLIKPNVGSGSWTVQGTGDNYATLMSSVEFMEVSGLDAKGAPMTVKLAVDNSLTAPMLTLVSEPQTPVEPPLHGIVYDWKSHTLLNNVAVIAGGGAEPAEGDSAPIWFSNPTWDASGHATIEVWTHSATPFENAGFGLQIAGATGISFAAGALPKTAAGASAWSVVTNVAGDVITVAGMGLGAPIAQTDFLLGTVSFEAGSAQNLALQLQKGEVGDVSATPFGFTGSRALTTTAGEFSFSDLAPGSYGVYASRSASDSGNAVNSADALATLKMAVGINPNPDPDGSGVAKAAVVSPYQFMAADVVGTDGRVTSADAFAILKMAVDLPTAPSKAWMFVEESRDFWNELTGSFSLDRNAAGWDHKIDAQATGEVNLVGVLKGDVNGSWAAPAGSTDLDVVSPGYFSALTQVYGMPMAQFGFSTTSGFVVD